MLVLNRYEVKPLVHLSPTLEPEDHAEAVAATCLVNFACRRADLFAYNRHRHCRTSDGKYPRLNVMVYSPVSIWLTANPTPRSTFPAASISPAATLGIAEVGPMYR